VGSDCPNHVEECPVRSIVQARHARRGLVALGAAALIATTVPPAVGAAPGGFVTSRPSMLAKGPDGGATSIQPIITVGDAVGDDYEFLSIPDGIGVKPAGKNGAQVYVNHETSLVPFPYVSGPTTSNSFDDFDNSQVSKLILRKSGGTVGVNSAAVVIPSSANFQRFCSNFLALSDGFENRPMLFTNEESPDWTNETGVAWSNATSLETAPGARENGLTVAYDLNSKTYQAIWGMGRFNHENTVAIPGYGHPFLMSGDDTFTSTQPQSQVYAYSAADADAVWGDAGSLMAFVPDEAYADINDYYDFAISSNMSISGHFIPVPKMIATGKLPSGAEITADTVPASIYGDGGPYPEPPNDGTTWQRRPLGSVGIDGPQWVLEVWSDRNNVFQFTRIEDMAFDKRDGMSNVVYMADSGRGRAGTEAPTVEPFPQPFTSSNGRIWRMELDPNDPTVVDSLSILIEGDDHTVKTVTEVHQPDNLETTVNGLYITEDPGSQQQFSAQQQIDDAARATTARLWQYKFSDESLNRLFKIDQSLDELAGYDMDETTTAGRWGEWETTGIVDVSEQFGPGTFLINVQAHTLFTEIDTTSAPDNLLPAGPDWTWKREGGQLLLITIPGG
jgi:hypothetical protein